MEDGDAIDDDSSMSVEDWVQRVWAQKAKGREKPLNKRLGCRLARLSGTMAGNSGTPRPAPLCTRDSITLSMKPPWHTPG